MQLKKIVWKVLANTGNPCMLCKKHEAEYFATLPINDAGTLTTQLCDECVKLDDKEVLERILP